MTPEVKRSVSTQLVRFLVISDTHSMKLGTNASAGLRHPLPDINVSLHCGDLTDVCSLADLEDAISLLSSIPGHLCLVIPGNHDTLLDPAFVSQLRAPLTKEAIARGVKDLVSLAAQRGVTFLDEGLYHFTLPDGAFFSVYASPLHVVAVRDEV